MDARHLLLSQHALTHSEAVADADGRPIPPVVWTRVNPAQLRQCEPGHNSTAWLLWHLARGEDAGINAFVRGVPEVLDRDGWLPRLRIDDRHIGTGASNDDMVALSKAVDLDALLAYRDAVGRETRTWLETADLDALDGDTSAAARVALSQDWLPGVAPVMARVFDGRSGTWVVSRLAVWHNFLHLGDVSHVMSTLGIRVLGGGP